jgi:hypothetical protein
MSLSDKPLPFVVARDFDSMNEDSGPNISLPLLYTKKKVLYGLYVIL